MAMTIIFEFMLICFIETQQWKKSTRVGTTLTIPCIYGWNRTVIHNWFWP